MKRLLEDYQKGKKEEGFELENIKEILKEARIKVIEGFSSFLSIENEVFSDFNNENFESLLFSKGLGEDKDYQISLYKIQILANTAAKNENSV